MQLRTQTINLKIDPKTFTRDYLQLLNGIMGVSPRQLEVVIAIYERGSILTTRVRKQVRDDLNFNGFNALNIIIMRLKAKGVLIYENRKLVINPYIVPLEDQLRLVINFVK